MIEALKPQVHLTARPHLHAFLTLAWSSGRNTISICATISDRLCARLTVSVWSFRTGPTTLGILAICWLITKLFLIWRASH